MGNNLMYYRARSGLNQRELGEKIGLGDATISLAEHSKLPVKTALKAAKVLNVNAFTLLGTDALRLIPKTEEDREALIETIKNIVIE